MRRVHLFELEDQSWLPRPVRDGATDLLDVAFDRMRVYDGVSPQLEAVLDATRAARIVDLGSGGGGGTLTMVRRLRAAGRNVEVVMTDLYPSEAGMARVAALGDPRITYSPDRVDARRGGGPADGVRTSSSALHHFGPGDVRGLIAGVVATGQPLAFFDVAASPRMRGLPIVFAPVAMAVNMVMLFVAALVIAPFARPHRWSRLLLTYVVPVIPLVFAWDGTVSALRAYLPEELEELARSVPGSERYTWRSEAKGLALCLTGVPRGPLIP